MKHWRSRAPRVALVPALVCAAVLAVAGCGGGGGGGGGGGSSASGSGGRVTLRIGDQGKSLQLPLDLSGQSKGTSYGLNWNTFADGPHMNAAFSAGRIDVGYMGDTPVLYANAARAGVRVVSVQKSPKNTQVIIATKKSGIRTPADLKGKRVAFTTGTSLQGYLLNQLQSAGLTQKDITTVNVPVTSLVSTFESGNVDAFVYIDQYTAGLVKANPNAVRVAVTPLPQYGVILASQKALADPAKRAAIKDFVVRLARASTWPKQHSQEWVNAYFVKQLHQNPAASARYFDAQPVIHFGPVGDDFVESQRVQARLLIGVGQLPSSLNVEDEIDAAVNREFNPALAAAVPAT
ncbi:MAG: ABC transporter substrate-binding protein [Frankia sp.]